MLVKLYAPITYRFVWITLNGIERLAFISVVLSTSIFLLKQLLALLSGWLGSATSVA